MAIPPAFPFNEGIGLLLLVLSTPHMLYLFTWTCAGAFTRFAKAVGVEAFKLFYTVKPSPPLRPPPHPHLPSSIHSSTLS